MVHVGSMQLFLMKQNKIWRLGWLLEPAIRLKQFRCAVLRLALEGDKETHTTKHKSLSSSLLVLKMPFHVAPQINMHSSCPWTISLSLTKALHLNVSLYITSVVREVIFLGLNEKVRQYAYKQWSLSVVTYCVTNIPFTDFLSRCFSLSELAL